VGKIQQLSYAFVAFSCGSQVPPQETAGEPVPAGEKARGFGSRRGDWLLQFHVLSFEGPDPYSRAGGLASRVEGLTETLATLGFETHLWFIGDPELPGHEIHGDLHPAASTTETCRRAPSTRARCPST
jgi:hypothetical protein